MSHILLCTTLISKLVLPIRVASRRHLMISSSGSAGEGGGGGSESESGNGGAGTVASSSPPETVVGSRLHKTTNLSAHLITVPAILPNTKKERVALAGMGVETVEEIARGILRLS